MAGQLGGQAVRDTMLRCLAPTAGQLGGQAVRDTMLRCLAPTAGQLGGQAVRDTMLRCLAPTAGQLGGQAVRDTMLRCLAPMAVGSGARQSRTSCLDAWPLLPEARDTVTRVNPMPTTVSQYSWHPAGLGEVARSMEPVAPKRCAVPTRRFAHGSIGAFPRHEA